MPCGVRLEPLPSHRYREYRSEAIWAACKWDPQIGDVSVLCDHAVVFTPDTAGELSALAETLAAETLALDTAVLKEPRLWRHLGLGRRLESALRQIGPDGPDDVRLHRFDFHPTQQGWAVSEVNADVPGGLGEAAVLPLLAAQMLPCVSAPGPEPAPEVANAFARRLPQRGTIALMHATAYSDDRQVMEYVARSLRSQGFHALLTSPDHIRCDASGGLVSVADGQSGPVHGVYRFFPAEWLPNLARGWERFFRTPAPSCNHPVALLSQTKRAPLAWSHLGVPHPAWGSHLPTTVDPRRAAWVRDPAWVPKPALGRVGEDVALREVLTPKEWKRIRRGVRLHPRAWVTQRRFDCLRLPSASGDRYVCVGVYTVDGRAAGFYARVAANPRVDQFAQDAPVVVERRPNVRQGA